MGLTLDDYLAPENEAAFNALTDEQKADIFTGKEIDAPATAEPEVPADESTPPAEDPTPEAEPAPAAPSVEEQLREELRAAQELARQATALLEAARQPPAAPPATEPAPTAPKVSVEDLLRQANEAFLEGDLDKANQFQAQALGEVRRQTVEEVRQTIEQTRQEELFRSEQVRLDAVAQKAVTDYPFLDVGAPDKNPAAIELVVLKRDSLIAAGTSPSEALQQAVASVAPLFAPKPKEAAAPSARMNDDAAKRKAEEVVTKAMARVPVSLSEAPGGTAPHHDEAAAMLEMNSLGLLNKFAGKTPDQIMALVAKAV